MPPLNPHARENLEQALPGLTPQAADLDRDRLMFAAGAASTRRTRRAWQGLGAACGLVAAALALILMLRPANVITETVTRDRYVYVPVPVSSAITRSDVVGSTAPTAVAINEDRPVDGDVRLLQVRGVILRWGVDALPKPQIGQGGKRPEPPPTSAFDVRCLLGTERF